MIKTAQDIIANGDLQNVDMINAVNVHTTLSEILLVSAKNDRHTRWNRYMDKFNLITHISDAPNI